jgi:asparagine N-glycosylation enzyme membrane subunit Stt3
MADEIKLNFSGVKSSYNYAKNFLSNKRNVWVLILILLLVIVSFSSWARVQNLPLLVDSTTGEYIPIALDPFYFLRLAETISEQGGLPEVDNMRYHPSAEIGFTNEILPYAVVYMHKFISVFNSDVTLQYIGVISPVVFFVLGLIVFFFLTYFLTNSKLVALVSTGFLSIMPPYLYRTMAGFSDHEAPGIMAFFLVLLGYTLALKKLEKEPKLDFKKVIFYGLGVGFLSAFTIASWGGVANFVFLIIPISFSLFWLINTRDWDEKSALNSLVFYGTWFVSSILFTMIYGFSLYEGIGRVTLTSANFINGAILLFIICDFLNIKFSLSNKIHFLSNEKNEKYRTVYSLGMALISGVMILIFSGNLGFLSSIFSKLLTPFGTERVGLTVAENAQPFLNDWIGQMGKRLFWLFFAGVMFLGFEMSKGISKHKDKLIFISLWAFMVFGILFSRISSSSLLNGTNFISKLFYFGSVAVFLIYLVWIYFNDRIKVRSEYLIIFPWVLLMLVATRSAVRVFFIITPLAAFMAGFGLYKLIDYAKKTRDDLVRLILILVSIAVIIALMFSVTIFANTIMIQGKNTGPSAHGQWQQAMDWVRDNTPENSIFAHWWDYGYWVQYLGERTTIADGGHFQGVFRTHMIGRYILTNPNPETALSFMKSNEINYLLIDPTDLGKYPAYSRIGSDDTLEDRYSQIPVMVFDSSQSQTNGNTETRLYQGGTFVDEDIVYNLNGNQVFLPQNRAGVGAVIVDLDKSGNQISFKQPIGIFVYNGQQIRIPLRYIYFNNQIIDFNSGIESVIRIIPVAIQGDGIQIDNAGAAIYLSPKVKDGLFAQLYLMNDAFGNYPTVQLAHSEHDSVVSMLNTQGANIGEFAYFNGFRGPIKIWEVSYPDSVEFKEEFTRNSGEYAEFDDLFAR